MSNHADSSSPPHFSRKNGDHTLARAMSWKIRMLLLRVLESAPLIGPIYLLERGLRAEAIEAGWEAMGLWPLSVGFGLGAVFLVGAFVFWLRMGRCRDGWHVAVAITHVASGALTLWMGSTNASPPGPMFDELVEDPTLYLVPVWLTMVLGILTIVYQLRSPKP